MSHMCCRLSLINVIKIFSSSSNSSRSGNLFEFRRFSYLNLNLDKLWNQNELRHFNSALGGVPPSVTHADSTTKPTCDHTACTGLHYFAKTSKPPWSPWSSSNSPYHEYWFQEFGGVSYNPPPNGKTKLIHLAYLPRFAYYSNNIFLSFCAQPTRI